MTTNIIVLTPNGRRQIIKATPNTTILQVLEEACKRQGFEADEFDLKHHRNVLDTSVPMRFSGLPNNALVEMIPISKLRSDGELVLGVHLESGERLTGNFKPQDKVIDVLNALCPSAIKPDENPVVVYMRREVYGKALHETSLRDLGLTNGRAMFRLIHRTPEELKTQANVSTLLPVKPTEEKPYIRKFQKIEEPLNPVTEPVMSNPSNVAPQKPNNEFEEVLKPLPEIQKKDAAGINLLKVIKQEKRKQTDKATEKVNKKPILTEREDDVNFIFLGARNAMLFSYETAKAIHSEDLTDEFFDLTINDAKRLLKDLKKQRLSMENANLATAAMRELEESKKQLRLLNQYKKAIIRIQFPNYVVLQGTFLPSETIDHVIQFVKEYLMDANLNFYLFTTPPKEILDPSSKLIEVGFVPGALIHFGSDVDAKNNEYLKRELQSKLTTLSKASLFSTKVRDSTKKEFNDITNDDDMDVDEVPNDVNVGASTSAGCNYEDYPQKQPVVEQQKRPKWFKP